MKFINSIKKYLMRSKYHLTNNGIESIIWLVNLVPSRAGFSILKDTISAPFWILHLSLLVYVYGVGNVVYQVKFAQGAGDFIKSYVNISLFILISNNSYWFLMKRSLLRTVLEQVNRNDRLSMQSDFLKDKHEKLLSTVKRIVLIFYGFNLFNASFIYLPHRVDVSNDYYSMTPCVGIEPLNVTPNREICHAILFTQEITIMTVVLNYQALLLFLIDHTSAMYQMLSAEMLAFDDYKDCPERNAKVKKRLPFLIERHALILDIIKNLKALYSMPIGINFGSNAVCISLFFYLPLQEWVMFTPILVYCFLVFFLYCFLCQRLINASEVFENAIYSCGWEKFDLKEKKTVYVMLLVAQKPVTLLAADIIPVNIYTFATTLQAMFKFITVVKF
ncbi:odorant receptor 49a-like [Maniola hyperantus]|uniref:odorant receptor 49a-like n=1 Tax=Aphantopus hyperantus TaxID=2795564 RepID=UPI00156A29E6|nr:odorant receptor 59b-like [Maniola hyperantus]